MLQGFVSNMRMSRSIAYVNDAVCRNSNMRLVSASVDDATEYDHGFRVSMMQLTDGNCMFQ